VVTRINAHGANATRLSRKRTGVLSEEQKDTIATGSIKAERPMRTRLAAGGTITRKRSIKSRPKIATPNGDWTGFPEGARPLKRNQENLTRGRRPVPGAMRTAEKNRKTGGSIRHAPSKGKTRSTEKQSITPRASAIVRRQMGNIRTRERAITLRMITSHDDPGRGKPGVSRKGLGKIL